MIGQDTLPLETRYHRLEVTNRWLLGIGAVILAALIALAIWVAVDRFALTGNATRVDPWISAATGDSFAEFQALYATDVEILSPETSGMMWSYAQLENIYDQAKNSGLSIERTGSIATFGPFATFHVRFQNARGYEGTGVATFEYNDAGLITQEAIIIEY